MQNNDDKILLAHGAGGKQSRDLVNEIFAKHFSNPTLDAMGDAGVVEMPGDKIAMTTDGYVVKPIFFPGGNIGKLAICGTVNDLAVSGAKPRYITAGFVIEEGFPLRELEEITSTMAKAAKEAGVAIIAGDTKVVARGDCEGVFITTAGIGEIVSTEPITPDRIQPGDAIIINGSIADHGMAIMAARKNLSLSAPIVSDCASLGGLTSALMDAIPETRFMRDATRGGLAAVLCEACEGQKFGIEISEDSIPLNEATAATCEILGIDPLHVANEGKLIAFVPGDRAELALETLKKNPAGRGSAIIGVVTKSDPGRVKLATTIGTHRLISMPTGDLLPRIC
jgi:hydrogenase expression/formation protein HypE